MNVRKLMTEREYALMILRDDYLLGRTIQKWTLKKLGDYFGVKGERARQIYTKAKTKQLQAYTRRIQETTGVTVDYLALEKKLGSRLAVTQYLEKEFWEVLRD